MSNELSSAVAVWGAASWFVNATSVPASTVSVSGSYLKSTISTESPVPEPALSEPLPESAEPLDPSAPVSGTFESVLPPVAELSVVVDSLAGGAAATVWSPDSSLPHPATPANARAAVNVATAWLLAGQEWRYCLRDLVDRHGRIERVRRGGLAGGEADRARVTGLDLNDRTGRGQQVLRLEARAGAVVGADAEILERDRGLDERVGAGERVAEIDAGGLDGLAAEVLDRLGQAVNVLLLLIAERLDVASDFAARGP